ARVALLFTLNVDGRHAWSPRDPQDAAAGALFGAHQRRDKGFGPALGAGAVTAFRSMLQAAGYRVFGAPSDWWIDGRGDARAAGLQRALVEGMAGAACEQDPASTACLQGWRERRLALAGGASLRVG